MNRLQYILTAKTQYDIQSPFLFEFYNEVLNPRLGRETMTRQGLKHGDAYAALRYKIQDYYGANKAERRDWDVDDVFLSGNHGLIGLVRSPHADKGNEERWKNLIQSDNVTLSVDLFDVGVLFTDVKLSKQHVLLRCI